MTAASRARVLLLYTDRVPEPSLVERIEALQCDVAVAPLRPEEPAQGSADLILIHDAFRSSEVPDAIRRLVSARPELQVVAVVDGDDPAPVVTALGAGASYAVHWPDDPGVLEQIAGRALARHRAQAQLVADQRRYLQLVDNAPIGVFELEGGTLTYVNSFLEEISGYAREELIGRSAADLVVEDERQRLIEAVATRADGATPERPSVYRFVGKGGRIYVGEVRSRVVQASTPPIIEGTLRDITQETRLTRMHRAILDLSETILSEQDIDRILQLVLDTITEYSGFRRAVLSLYDLSIPIPFHGDVYKILCSGLSPQEEENLLAHSPMPVEERALAFCDEYRLGPAYYIPHNRTPWSAERGIAGTVSVDGWHVDDFLFIPLRGTGGIIGSISVDDPIDQSVPTIAAIEPVSSLADLAALAVERLYKMNQLRRQKDRLHGLWGFGSELAGASSIEALCDLAARRVRDDMDYDYCAIWIVDGGEMVKLGLSTKPLFPPEEIPVRGLRAPIEGKGITRWAFRYREPLVVPDVRIDARYNGSRQSIRSVIAVPVAGRRGPFGVIGGESQRLAAFGNEDLEVLSALASQLSTAIAALQRSEALQSIYAFGQQVAAASATDQIIASTLNFLENQFGYDLCALFLTDDGGELAIAAVRGPYEEAGVKPGWRLPSGAGVVGWVARNRRTALVDDVATDPRYYAAYGETCAELAVPVLFSGRLLGVLNVESRARGFFDAEDQQLIEVIANHLATALSNLASQRTLRDQAVRDPLTGLYNRHYFNSLIASELDRSDRYGHPLTLMMVDIDGFRAINNRFGHLKGDDVLREVAVFLEENVRSADRIIRYGGDEFLVFMPETDEEAPRVARRLKDRIAAVPRRTGVDGVTIGLSIGLYTRRPNEDRALESILEEVDRRMYADKRQGAARRSDADDD